MDYIAEFGYHWFWFGIATLLLAIEALHGRFMVMAVSLAAVVVGIQSSLYPQVGFDVQVLFFVVLGLGFVWLSRAFMRDRMATIAKQQDLITNKRYVGRVVTLVNPIENGHSSLNVDGTVWALQGPDAPSGSQVKVVDMGAGWLKVETV